MKLTWKIEDKDVSKVKTLIAKQAKNAMVLARTQRNLAENKAAISRERLWRSMVCMRLTSQQRSGPDSPVAGFIRTKPFPLEYAAVRRAKDREALISKTLKDAGGIRFTETIAEQLAENFKLLESRLWDDTLARCNQLLVPATREQEVEVAEHIRENFKGFGPKQSRNVLQSLGLTRYEIPIDSRVTDWLNDFGFPVCLSAQALGDRNYYSFVSDGIQLLCERASVFPCVFDAAVFASKDIAEWTEENVAF